MRRPGERGSTTATTWPGRIRSGGTTSNRSPGSKAGTMLSPTTSTRRINRVHNKVAAASAAIQASPADARRERLLLWVG